MTDVTITLTERERSLLGFALHRFVNDARWRMSAAGQDKQGQFFKPGTVEACHRDALDTEQLIGKLRAASLPCEVCGGTGGVQAHQNGRTGTHPCPRGCKPPEPGQTVGELVELAQQVAADPHLGHGRTLGQVVGSLIDEGRLSHLRLSRDDFELIVRLYATQPTQGDTDG